MFIVMGIAISRAVGVLQTEPGLGPCIGEGVASLSDDHVGLVIQAFRGCSRPGITEIAQLTGRFQGVIPIPDIAGVGFESEPESINIASARLRELGAGFGAGSLRRSIARQE